MVFVLGNGEKVEKSAVISDDGLYRYALRRQWSDDKPYVTFIMLNPSTADDSIDDPTIRRCVGFAKRWGYGGIAVGNLFALRATDPKQLETVADPIGPENDRVLRSMVKHSPRVIVAWGNGGAYKSRAAAVCSLLEQPFCLGVTKTGYPRHPLYVKSDQEPLLLCEAVKCTHDAK